MNTAREKYLSRYAYRFPKPVEPADRQIRNYVVIPVHNEPDLSKTLESLQNCNQPKGSIQVILVFNYPENSHGDLVATIHSQYNAALRWSQENHLPVLLYLAKNLPAKHAGVGLARKIGMDWAIYESEKDFLITCLDADCTVSADYFRAIENHFHSSPDCPGASVYFEHPLQGSPHITLYELHLRYFIHAQKYAGFPYAYQTVGSSMVVRSEAYIKAGGMNTRKAGEDFYFLHRIIPMGNFGEITDCCVYPSARISTRVPFGTGRAMLDMEKGRWVPSYQLDIFLELKVLFESVAELYEGRPLQLPAVLMNFLEECNFRDSIDEILSRSRSYSTFKKHFYSWFDAFRLMKYANHRRQSLGVSVELNEEASKLLDLKGIFSESKHTRELLELYRKLDRMQH